LGIAFAPTSGQT